jgi:hypothetical protein
LKNTFGLCLTLVRALMPFRVMPVPGAPVSAQPAKVSPVSDSVAFPARAGLPVTFAFSAYDLQIASNEPWRSYFWQASFQPGPLPDCGPAFLLDGQYWLSRMVVGSLGVHPCLSVR